MALIGRFVSLVSSQRSKVNPPELMKVFLFEDDDSEFDWVRWCRLVLSHFLNDSGSMLFPSLLFCAGAVHGLFFSWDRFICSQFSNVWAGFLQEYSCRRLINVLSCSSSSGSFSDALLSVWNLSCSREDDRIFNLSTRDSDITMSSFRIPFVLPEAGLKTKQIKQSNYNTAHTLWRMRYYRQFDVTDRTWSLDETNSSFFVKELQILDLSYLKPLDAVYSCLLFAINLNFRAFLWFICCLL